MANGQIIEELKSIVAQGGEIPPDIQNRLVLTLLGEIYTKQDALAQDFQVIKEDLEKVKRHDLVALVQLNPVLSFILFGILVTISNIWFISSWRKAVLIAFGVPPQMVP